MTENYIRKDRIKYFDLLKGLAIFAVVMGHVLTMCIRDIDSAFLFKIIETVHMPVFFFISGYLTYKIGYKTPNLSKRFKQLMIPFFIVSALWIWYFPHSGLKSPISASIHDMYCNYWKDGYWFTLCLFEMFLLYFPTAKIFAKISNLATQIAIASGLYIFLIILSVHFSTPQQDIAGLGLLATFYPVFMTGVFAHRCKEQYKKITAGGTWFLVGLILFIPTWYITTYYWEFPSIPSWFAHIANPIKYFGLIIIAVTLVIPWSEKEFAEDKNPGKIARYFNYIGQESLAIYLLHYFFLFPLTPLQEPLREMGLSLVPLLIVTVIFAFVIIGITLFANYAIQRNKWLALLLTGKEL